jgi:hypothetical protein
MAPWAGAYTDAEGEVAYFLDDALGLPICTPNDRFFDRMDARVRAVNEAGLLAVPVLAWAAKFGESARHNPGIALPALSLAEIIEYQVKRYAGHHVLWILAGDGRYGGLRSFKWKRIGRRVFGSAANRAPVAFHPMGEHWPYRWFRHEKWLDVLGYQSSHSDAPRTLNWLLTGPPAKAWQRDVRPVINLEPCYEGIRNWGGQGPFTNAEIRRATYASLLNAPTAGVSYGAHGVWSWETEPREPLNHPGSLVARPWHEAMQFPGSFDVQRLAGLFTSVPWWRLCPAQGLLASQPGEHDPKRFVSAAATDGWELGILYLPAGGEVTLRHPATTLEWFNPRTAERHRGEFSRSGTYAAPTQEDWVLLVQQESEPRA